MKPLVIVAVASYRRPALLARLLASLQAQTGIENVNVEIVVVDNSPEFELAAFNPVQTPLHTCIVSEPEPGISAARNKALAIVRERGADFVALIDDDEVAQPDWLAQLLRKQGETGADAVIGVVRGAPGPEAPPWMRAPWVFDTVPPARDVVVGAGYSCNSLFRLAAAEGLGFPADFGLTGGEDTYFFAQMRGAGGKFAHAWEAVVVEPTAPERAKLAWLARRWTREALSEGEVTLRLRMSPPVVVFLRGLVRLGAGTALAVVAAPFSFGPHFHRCARHLRVAARGIGYMMAAMRVRIHEYRR